MVQHNQHHKPNNNWNLDYAIIFDSGSTTKGKLINYYLVTNIKTIKNTLHMYTNACTKKITLQVDVKEVGDVWYDPT